MNIETMVMDYVQQEILRGRRADMSQEDDLLSSGIIDSLGVLKLVTFLEERLKIQIPDEDVMYENFNSVRQIALYLAGQQKIGA